MENGIGPLIWLTDLSTHGFRMSICMSKQGKVSCYYAQFSKQFALYAVYITILALFCDAQAILGWPTGSVESRCGTMTCTNVYHMINYGSSLRAHIRRLWKRLHSSIRLCLLSQPVYAHRHMANQLLARSYSSKQKALIR